MGDDVGYKFVPGIDQIRHDWMSSMVWLKIIVEYPMWQTTF
jgi:hypothetical protein